MRSLSLKWRILLVALLPAGLLAIALGSFFISARLDEVSNALRDRVQAIARQMAPAAEYGVFTGNRDLLKWLSDSAAKEADVSLVMITDSAGQVLAASGDVSKQTLLAEQPKSVTWGVLDYSDVLYYSAPIYQTPTPSDALTAEALGRPATANTPKPSRQIGWVSIFMSKATSLARRDQIVVFGTSLMLVCLGVTAFVALRMTERLSRRVTGVVSALDRITKGDLDTRLETLSGGTGEGDEIEAIGRHINSMAVSLKSAQENLQEKIDSATKVISYQASHDTLTGLVNRREFEIRLDRALTSAREQARTHALCFMDLDQFKIVNDTCGHNAGDELLRQIALQLRQKVREGDTLARIGGDEFTLLLENCSLEDAFQVATQLRETLQAFRFVWQDKVFAIAASIGLVAINKNSESVAALLSQADAACYTAKDMGRNRVYIFNEDDEARSSRLGAMEWVNQINRAFDEQRFVLYGQLIKPVGAGGDSNPRYEVLLRMRGDEREPILPMAFIPAAERFNQMQAIDRWVIRQSLHLLKQVTATREGAKVSFSVNLSGASLCDERFGQFLQEQFAYFAVPSQQVCFEITETAAITNLTHAINLIREFKKSGCKFVLDDFGSGLSSFSYLKNLPVDGIKIDGAFVRGIARDPMDFSMVEAINKIGHVMGLTTTAEFVESAAIYGKLQEIGVDYVQGHWVHEPAPLAEEFAAMSKRGEPVLKLVADNPNPVSRR
jgi:diguanylate cyclase (GGDEF)-like protein